MRKTFKQFVSGDHDEEKKLNESVEEDNEMEEETSSEEEIETTNESPEEEETDADEPSSGLSEVEEELVAKKMTVKEKIAAINSSDVLSSSFGVLPKD